MGRWAAAIAVVVITAAGGVQAGPYRQVGVAGYVGEDGRHADPCAPGAQINPIFRGWASEVAEYAPAPGVGLLYNDPECALGPATGDQYYDVVSLGDLNKQQISQGVAPGRITLEFAEPNAIRDGAGYDFVVFENGFAMDGWWPDSGAGVGSVFAELGYVEVSSDGVHFVRFESVSLTEQPDDTYVALTIDVSDVRNFAGKHPNAYGICFGTPFDLAELADRAEVVSGLVDLDDIRYVRIVDIPGTGAFMDAATGCIDPATYPDWYEYESNHPIYDPWLTWDSGGVDLEAIGVLQPQQYRADINLDGAVDMMDFSLFMAAWQSRFGEERYLDRCDMAEPRDRVVDVADLAVFAEEWLQRESWRVP